MSPVRFRNRDIRVPLGEKVIYTFVELKLLKFMKYKEEEIEKLELRGIKYKLEGKYKELEE